MSTLDSCHLIAFDAAQFDRICDSLRDATTLTHELSQVTPSPDADVARLESVIASRKLEGLSRTLVMLRAPRAWAPEIAKYVTTHSDGQWKPLLQQAIARQEQWLLALGTLVTFSPRFRERFLTSTECSDFPERQSCVLEALGGEPDASATEEAEALKSAIHAPLRVKLLADELSRIDVTALRLPRFETLTDEQFELELERVSALADQRGEVPRFTSAMRFTELGFGGERGVLEALSTFYSAAAANEWSVSVNWGRGP